MILQGERCILRAWAPADADMLVRHADDFEVARQLRDRFPHPYTAAHARAFLASSRGAESPRCDFAIEVDGAARGGVGFSVGTDLERYCAEIGYWLGRAYWGRGIATEAVILLCHYLFRELNLLRLYAVPFADNRASARVLEKAGFVQEALLRSACVKHGTPRDQLLYARVNPDWKGENE